MTDWLIDSKNQAPTHKTLSENTLGKPRVTMTTLRKYGYEKRCRVTSNVASSKHCAPMDKTKPTNKPSIGPNNKHYNYNNNNNHLFSGEFVIPVLVGDRRQLKWDAAHTAVT